MPKLTPKEHNQILEELRCTRETIDRCCRVLRACESLLTIHGGRVFVPPGTTLPSAHDLSIEVWRTLCLAIKTESDLENTLAKDQAAREDTVQP